MTTADAAGVADPTERGPRGPEGPLVIHPPLVAAYPILFLFVENAVHQVRIDPLWAPLAAALAFGVAVFLALAAATRSWMRGGLLATLWLALFFSFGHAWNLIEDLGWLTQRRWLVAAYLIIGIVGTVVALRPGAWLRTGNRVANVMATFLVAFALVGIGQFLLGTGATPTAAARSAAVPLPQPVAARPDVFFIVLDRYPNAATLATTYDFDNGPFLDALAERGFLVANDAWANYVSTSMSMLSTLRMEHLERAELHDGDPPTLLRTHQALQGSLPVPATLKSLGYEYVHIGSLWVPTSTNIDADRVLARASQSQFASAVVSTTFLSIFIERAVLDGDVPETTDDAVLARETTLFTFEALEEAAGRPGPKYVFAHLLVPHPPYVFQADGSLPDPQEHRRLPDQERFLRQLTWTNGRVLDAIDRILADATDGEPAIIIAADEGTWPDRYFEDIPGFDWTEARPEEVAQKYGILHATRLPAAEARAAGWHEAITPVNTFRVVFNVLFDAGLPLRPDVTYLSPRLDRPYDFTPYRRCAAPDGDC